MLAHEAPKIVAGPEALADFRRGLTGSYAFDLLDQAGGRLLAQLPVGVGKSKWLLEIIQHNHEVSPRYDLIIALFPRWDILNEVVAQLSPSIKHVVLRPRPQKQCGRLNDEWVALERAGCGLLGRQKLCSVCRRRKCFWPFQHGEALLGASLILTTQQHLLLDPQFIGRLKRAAEARKTLLLVDESALLLKSQDRTIAKSDMEQFIAAIESDDELAQRRVVQRWITRVRLILEASTADLQGGHWRFPSIHPAWAVVAQEAGRRQFGDRYRFICYDLQQFTRSDRASREKLPNGDLRFAVPPSLGREFIVFSGSIAKELVRYRLDPNHRWPSIASPFADIEFVHPDTRWFDIASTAGAACYFQKNAPSILDFFAARIADNIHQGKRTLLVAKKCFRSLCASYMTKRLRKLGVRARVVTGKWDRADLTDPSTLPLITYGISGVNQFQHFDAVYCLTGYYIDAAIVTETVHDIDATADRFPISIRTLANPKRRVAHVELPDDRATILPHIAQGVLDQLEADVHVQAVGRVRPFTSPREVITFYAGQMPGVTYTMNFDSLGAAREYFGISTRRQSERSARAQEARELHETKLSTAEIAFKMNLSPCTIRRYLRD